MVIKLGHYRVHLGQVPGLDMLVAKALKAAMSMAILGSDSLLISY